MPDEPEKKYNKPFSHPRWNDLGAPKPSGEKVEMSDDEMRDGLETLIQLIEKCEGPMTEEQKDDLRRQNEEQIKKLHESE